MTKVEPVNGLDSFSETCSSIISGVITFFLLILVTVFPLIYHNSYFDILETKYRCFYMSVLGMIVIVLILSLIMMVVDFNEFKGEHTKAVFAALSPQNWKRTFCVADVAVLLFWGVCLISTLQSEYLYEAFWGNEGRYSGLFLISLYVIFYFLVSRCWKVREWIIEIFLISGLIMCIIGITDYFQLDILDFRTNIKLDQSTKFTSTVGNINTYTAYVSMIMGVAAARFANSKQLWKASWYYACLMISFFAMITGCSDNAYLAIGALFAFLPFVLLKKREGVLRYLMILAGFISVVQCIDMINQKFAGVVIPLDSIFKVLVNFKGLALVVVALWIATVSYYIFVCKGRTKGDTLGIGWVKGWGILIALGIVAVVFALFDANVLHNSARYGSIGNYLEFKDSWGTNRGYIWRKSVEIYQGFPLLHKLFGYGPDTFGIMTTQMFRFEMIDATGQVFDSAHNEYLQFLLTIGPIGLVSYVLFLVSSCFEMIKKQMKNPYILGSVCAVLCYGFQAIVNLNLPIATPMMWLLLSVGIAASRGDKQA